jgi:hypothetical protein
MTRDDDPIARQIKALISFVVSGISNKNTQGRLRGKFVYGCGG